MTEFEKKDECMSVQQLMYNSNDEDEDNMNEQTLYIIDQSKLKEMEYVPLEHTFKYPGKNFKYAFDEMFRKKINSDNKTAYTLITIRNGDWNILYFKEGYLYHIYMDYRTNQKLTCHGYKQIFKLSSIKHYLNPKWDIDYRLGVYDNYGSSPEISDKDFYESLSQEQKDFLKNTVYFSEMNLSE